MIRAELGLSSKEWIRRMTPVGLERTCFDVHTEELTDGKIAFFIDNALVLQQFPD